MFAKKSVLRFFILLFAILLISGNASASPLKAPLGTAFTYQGRLLDGGVPANGAYNLEFTLFDALSGGSQVGGTLTQGSVTVTNGLFTVQLDFGAVFNGTALYLEIGVRPGGSSGAYTTLTPRQLLSAAPYALFASNAALLDGLNAASFALTGHNHWGETWTGSGTGLTLNGGDTGLSGSGNTYGVSGSGLTGVSGTSTSTSGYGVVGLASATTGTSAGLYGRSNSTAGFGVYGYAAATSGWANGVFGQTASSGGNGVYGYASALSGLANGVTGNTTSGTGVYGIATATSGTTYGVYGQSVSTTGTGVYGSGGTYGVYGSGSTGVSGATTISSGYGVSGTNTSTSGTGVYGSGSRGVYGSGTNWGVYGTSTSGNGVSGTTSYDDGYGVSGTNTSGSGTGVYGFGGGGGAGVHGIGGTGVEGDSISTGLAGVYGTAYEGSGDYAGYFQGNVQVMGNVDVYGAFYVHGSPKSAVVDTQDYGTRTLYAVESPENWFQDFGTGQLTNSAAVITIDPVYAETVNLSDDYHVFFTPMGDCALYVTDKTPTSFTVKALGGQTCSIAFDYNIVAKRLGFEDLRLAVADPSPKAGAPSK